MPQVPGTADRPLAGGAPAPGVLPLRAAEIRGGHHVAHLYEGAAEQAEVGAEILAAALVRGDRGLLLAGPEAERATLAALAARGVDVAAVRQGGGLDVRRHGDVYLAGGRFDEARQLAFWGQEAARARREGHPALVAVAVMDWAFEAGAGAACCAYEARLGLQFPPDLSATCQYDLLRFPPDAVLSLLRSHALLLHGGTLLRNPYAIPAEVAFAPEPPEREVRRLLASLHAGADQERAVRESERRLRTVVSAVTAGIAFKGRRGELLDCNPAAERLLGVTRDPATGALAADPRLGAIREDGEPFPFEAWPAMVALRTGTPVRNELMGFTRADGSVRWARINAVPVAEPGAPPHAVVVSLDDLTEERQGWVEVRRKEQQLRVAMECAGHVYWELDMGVDRFAAGAPWTLLGWGERELDGSHRAWLELRHPDDRRVAQELLEAHVAGETPALRSELRTRARDGSYRWILTSGRALARGPDGRATRIAGTVTDVTETKHVELQLRQADRLASVGTLASGLAHEVNNPLACVMANLGYVAEGLDRCAADHALPDGAAALAPLREALREAQDGAQRVRDIVQGLRVFATPARSAPRQPVDPRAQIEAAVALVRNQIVARARLQVDLPPALPPVLLGEQELSQILVNLLVNAAQAVPEGRAAEHEVRVHAEAVQGALRITVQDSGVGIPPEDVGRIFDPFYTTRPVGGGTGLGLPMCHGMVQALGGRIEVEAAPGKGSRFRVVLPLAAPAPSPAPPAPGTGPAAARARVLIVDDEPLVARGIARIVGGRHEAIVLTSPREVLRRAEAGERWDVVLCDLMMPELSGMELEAQLARCRPDLVKRMVFLTGGAFTDQARAFLASGRPYLEKPVEWRELRALVDSMAGAGAGAGSA